MSSFRNLLICLALLSSLSSYSQEQGYGTISGNLDVTGQYYTEDESINAFPPDAIFGMNGFGNLNYTRGNFKAGLRYESYLNPLLGYPVEFQGTGIGYRYAAWENEDMQVTIGNFYEQFGTGMILRSFEERTLGLDNAFDGLKVVYRPTPGMQIKGLVGKQRFQFDDGLVNGNGIVRGMDVEMSLGELFNPIMVDSTEFQVRIGGSFVSKFNDDNNTTIYDLPQNVGAYGGRIEASYKDFRALAEYTYKENDPYPTTSDFMDPFNYLYKGGEGILVNLGYSTKGFALDFTAKHTDNILWRSTNQGVTPTALFIGFNPAITKQHTYNLASTLYPYATNLLGEIAFNADLIYKLDRGSELGGKYGTTITIGLATAYAPERQFLDDQEGARQGYTTKWFDISDSLLVRDFNVMLERKLSKKVKAKLMYMNLNFEDRAVLVAVKHEFIKANIAIADVLWKVKGKHSLRFEAQGLFTEQDQGDWAFGMIEYTYSPHWSISLLDQYNYGNHDANKRTHYALMNVTHVRGPHRFSVQYGRQRAGFFCVGGVCRFVPASNGLTLGLSTSF